jgi:hypothetical protein
MTSPSSLGPAGQVLVRSHNRFIHHRAVFNANAATGAQLHVDAPSPFPYLYLKISGASLYRLKIRVSDELDIQVPADLDQFGRDNSHGAVIGGKRLVQLGHDPADGRGFFKKIDVISGIRQIKGRLHPCDASTHNENRTLHLV